MEGKTSISVGYVVYDMLTASPDIMGKVTKVFPVAADRADLPYIVYRPIGFDQTLTKSAGYYDRVQVEVVCCASDYREAVELAECVRSVLDGAEGEHGGMYMNGCVLSDMVHDYDDDAFVVSLMFTINI